MTGAGKPGKLHNFFMAGRAAYITLCPFIRREMLNLTKEKPAISYFIDKGQFPIREVKPITLKEILRGDMPPVCLGQVKKTRDMVPRL